MKLGINNRKMEKFTNMWKLNRTLLNNQWVKEKINREIKQYLETNKNGNTTQRNFWDAAKAVLREQLLWFECLHPPQPPRSFTEILASSVMVSGSGVFGMCLGYESGALMNGISFLIKRPHRTPSPLSSCEDTARRCHL